MLPQLLIQSVAQPVTQQVERQNCDEDSNARKHRDLIGDA
jgi:hypothetical protein